MSAIGPRLFINYRSDDTGETASRLFNELERELEPNLVFIDHERLEGGDVWPERLANEVKNSTILFCLIGKRWLTIQDPVTGDRRLSMPEDWVRRELETALQNGTTIVPLLVDEAVPPPRKAFETIPNLARLNELQCMRLRRKDWPADFQEIVAFLISHGFSRRTDGVMHSAVSEIGLTHQAEPAEQSTVVRRKLFAAILTVVFVVIVLSGVAYYRGRRVRLLTDKDTIVLLNFTNRTGDTVFDETLNTALSIALNQSPFLRVLSDKKVAETLRLMARPANTPLNADLASEVCVRSGSKAYISGSIASLASKYVVNLKAVNCETGEVLAQEQATAATQEKVLDTLSEVASKLRSQLGESMATVQKFDVPLAQATTPSLEALKAYGLAMKILRSQGDAAAIPHLKRAITLDQNFAIAYQALSECYAASNQFGWAAKYAIEAHERRNGLSEPEKFSVDATYYFNATREQDRAAAVYEQWKQVYPRDLTPIINLGVVYIYLGRLQDALDNDLTALALAPDSGIVYSSLAYDYIFLNRFAEAKSILDRAHALHLDGLALAPRYQLAFLQDDAAEMQRRVAEASSKPGLQDQMLSTQADTEAFYGRLIKARDLSAMAVNTALAEGAQGSAATWHANAALREAEFGNAKDARLQVDEALELDSSPEVQVAAAMALARVGEDDRALKLVDDLKKRFPTDTLLITYWLPSIQAAVEINHNRNDVALGLLEPARMYELGGAPPPFSSGATLYPAYLRGEAYLHQRQWRQAAAEFRRVIDHRGLVWNFPLTSLSYLQLARADARSGDAAQARDAYQHLLSVWADADAELVVLSKAKQEYAQIK